MSFLKHASIFALSLSVLAGCGSSSSSNSASPTPPNDQQGAPVVVDESMYRPALVALITGDYSGSCVTYPDNQPSTASVVVSTAGDVTSPGATGSLLGYSVAFTFARQFTGGVPVTASLSTADLTNNSGLNLVLRSGNTVIANNVSARQGVGNVPGIFCANSNQTTDLKNRSFYKAIAKFMLTPKKSVTCSSNNVSKPLDLTISLEGAQIGTESFSFMTGLRQERTGIIPNLNNLVYIANTEDGREFSVTLDKKGAISLLHFQDIQGAVTNCIP